MLCANSRRVKELEVVLKHKPGVLCSLLEMFHEAKVSNTIINIMETRSLLSVQAYNNNIIAPNNWLFTGVEVSIYLISIPKLQELHHISTTDIIHEDINLAKVENCKKLHH